jgi:hypothetical protein
MCGGTHVGLRTEKIVNLLPAHYSTRTFLDHYHERLTCLWDIEDSSGHASRAGVMLDAQGLYGYWEALNTLPVLDACGGHFGFTPDSPTQRVYRECSAISSPQSLSSSNVLPVACSRNHPRSLLPVKTRFSQFNATTTTPF